ncbi:MAG: hypothetical protein FJ317_07770 [SAR202 cluster bacterium]|nr:hypothetical protein [SAR202 cluster bacterium]
MKALAAMSQKHQGEKVGRGSCYGSFGELLQGFLPGGKKFLVNCKIKDASHVTVSLSSPYYSDTKELDYIKSYGHYPKSYKVIRNVLADFGVHNDCYLDVRSDLPIAKGLSSSTADMVASVRALSEALSIALKPEYVARVITEIDPNDGLHYPGTSCYHHTLGELISNFDYVPQLSILGIDVGGIVDTVEFNKGTFQFSEETTRQYQALLEQIQAALKGKDLPAICKVSTESARLWQQFRPKQEMDAILHLMSETSSLGVINAHSGTYVGLAYEKTRKDRQALEAVVNNVLPNYPLRWFETVEHDAPAVAGLRAAAAAGSNAR